MCQGASRDQLKRKDLSFNWLAPMHGGDADLNTKGKERKPVEHWHSFGFALTCPIGRAASCSSPTTLSRAGISGIMRQS